MKRNTKEYNALQNYRYTVTTACNVIPEVSSYVFGYTSSPLEQNLNITYKELISNRAGWAASRNRWPSSVSDMLRVVRWKRRTPRYFSSCPSALLAAWGGQTQAHVDLLLGDAAAIVEEDSVFLPAASNCLLAQLQNAILELRELEPGSIALAADDRSLEIHVCHSLTRQLEVLHDQLLALFAAPDPPALDQILVAVPDLSAAAPLIDAVFGTVPINRRIPYAITGLPARRSNPLARVLDDLLALCASRFTASSVFALLLQPAVAARFALTSDDLELIRGWMRETRMCWGLDGRERCQLQLPRVLLNSPHILQKNQYIVLRTICRYETRT